MNTSFGETLRKAREAKGLTTSQIAAKTRMLVQIVEEMENEDFHRIAAPIYGRGFVRLYAECVDLDPLPLVKEFMDIYEGRRAPIVRTREVPVHEQPPVTTPEPPPVVTPQFEPTREPEPTPKPPPAVTPQPEPIPEPPPAVTPQPEPIPEPPPTVTPRLEPQATVTTKPETAPEPIQEPPSVIRGLELFEAQAARQPQETNDVPPSSPPTSDQPPTANVADIFSGSPYLSTESSYSAEGPSAADRFRKSLSNVSHGVIQTVREIPRSVWRISLLSITALVLLAILVWGCIKLYNATSIKPIQQPQAIDTTQEPTGSKNSKVSKDSKDPKTSKNPKDLKAPKDLKDLKKPKAAQPPAKPQPTAKKQLRTTGQKVPPLYAD